MQFIINEDVFTHQVDWSRKDTVKEGELIEYWPDARESVEVFLKLLQCFYPRESLKKAIRELAGEP